MIASTIQLVGAAAFGVVLGWYVYYINRYRKGDFQLTDIGTLLGILGGAGIIRLFDPSTDLFGAYGIGLCLGFFAYLVTLGFQVAASPNFDRDWFLDGRRKRPQEPYYIPDEIKSPDHPPMIVHEREQSAPDAPGVDR